MSPRSRQVPVVLQMEITECGAACLAMVLASFGRWEKLDTVRDRCGASRDGTSATALIEAAKTFGLNANAFRREPADLGGLPLPQILFWTFDHFVVLERIEQDSFIIVDPASGRRRVTAAEFDRAFTGITLSFAPGERFARTRRPRGFLRRLPGMLKGSSAGFAAILVTSLITVILGVQIPGLTRIFVDDYLVQGYGDWLVPLLAGMLAVGVMRTMLGALYMRGLLRLQTKLTGVLSAQFIWRLLHLPFPFFASRSPAEVSARAGLPGQLSGIISGPMANAAVNLVAMTTYGAVMMAYSPLLTGVVLAVSALNIGIFWLTQRRVREGANLVQMTAGEAHAVTIRSVALLEQARATGSEAVLFGRMMNAHIRHINAEQQGGKLLRVVTALSQANSQLVSLAVLGVGAVQVIVTDMTLGTLMAMLMLAELFAGALGVATSASTSLGQANSALERLGDLLDRQLATEELKEAPSAICDGRLTCRGVSFSYPNGSVLFKDVELSVAARDSVAISGPSGSGKSTLARLLAGLATPDGGVVTVGTGTGHVHPEAARGIALVDQDPFFPAGTLRAALTLWNPQVPLTLIRQALVDAEIAHVIDARAGGIEGRISEGGLDFSGGERQRLAIARALVQDPRILVLDDATSGLDEATEARLLNNLRRRGVTLILITNRASVLNHVDHIWAIHERRLVPLAAEDVMQISRDTRADGTKLARVS